MSHETHSQYPKPRRSQYNPEKHHRQSIRLKGYDYARPGSYFITICTQNREHMFGEIKLVWAGPRACPSSGQRVAPTVAQTGKMILNAAGTMVQTVWDEIPQFYPGIAIDCFQIMPDHIHGIVVIQSLKSGHPQGGDPMGMSLPDVIQRFKSLTTKKYIDGVKQNGWPSFDRRLWQRNYYERIIRDQRALQNIRQYIINNPSKWATDKSF